MGMTMVFHWSTSCTLDASGRSAAFAKEKAAIKASAVAKEKAAIKAAAVARRRTADWAATLGGE
tara:strand:- start:197 stop:388 length:192 start_codon:yes stop_codon:yes gene_type:complete